MSDLSDEEFKAIFLGSKMPHDESERRLTQIAPPAPHTTETDYADWRGIYTTPIKYQDACGSCWWASLFDDKSNADLPTPNHTTPILHLLGLSPLSPRLNQTPFLPVSWRPTPFYLLNRWQNGNIISTLTTLWPLLKTTSFSLTPISFIAAHTNTTAVTAASHRPDTDMLRGPAASPTKTFTHTTTKRVSATNRRMITLWRWQWATE